MIGDAARPKDRLVSALVKTEPTALAVPSALVQLCCWMRQWLSWAQNEMLTRPASETNAWHKRALFEPVRCRTLAGRAVTHGELAQIADIDGPGEGVFGCQQSDLRLDQVVDTAERVCVPSP